MGLGWDPSMATTSCRGCGCCIEAWLDFCEDCEDEEDERKKIIIDGEDD